MKRDIIVSKLLKEGFSEKTLVKFSDNQLSKLANRILGEALTTTIDAMNKNPKLKDLAKTQDIKVVGEEGEIGESKTKKKKETIYDKALKDLGGEKGVIKFFDKELKGKKKKEVSEEKPSAGLSKEKKSEVVKKAKKGEDIGKKGKGFEKLADKASKEYGSKEKGQKVAAAAMWKNVKNESTQIKSWVNTLAEENFHSFTSKNEIMELINTKLNESETMEKPKVPEFMTYNAIKSSGPAVAPTKPKTSPTTKPGTSPKPKTPYQPGPGPKHKPKAGYGIKEEDVTETEETKVS